MEQIPLRQLFNEIVDAIHEKDGKTDGIRAKDFPDRIRELSSDSAGGDLSAIEITCQPDRTIYFSGDTFDPTGMAVQARLKNGAALDVPMGLLSYSPALSTPLADEVTVRVMFNTGANLLTADIPIVVYDEMAGVCGVVWDYSKPSTTLERLTPETDPYGYTTLSIWEEPVAAVGEGSGRSVFDHITPWSGMKEYNILEGEAVYQNGDPGFSRTEYDTMVYIPEFWYKVIDPPGSSKRYWYISSNEMEGFAKHPGSGKYIGRYTAGGNVKSVSNVYPMWDGQPALDMAATGKGAGWAMLELETWAALQLLYLVEFADFNSQEKVGFGNGGISNFILTNGETDSMQYHTGAAVDIGHNRAMQYRGVENVIGNAMCWIRNIEVRDRIPYISPAGTDNAYVTTGMSLPSASSGYQKSLACLKDLPWAFLPTAYGGAKDAYIPDYGTGNSGVRGFAVGGWAGSQDGGSVNGMFYFSSYDAKTNAVGVLRLQFTPQNI